MSAENEYNNAVNSADDTRILYQRQTTDEDGYIPHHLVTPYSNDHKQFGKSSFSFLFFCTHMYNLTSSYY